MAGFQSDDSQLEPFTKSPVWPQVGDQAPDFFIKRPSGKPRTTDLRPWLWGDALRGSSEHSSPHSRAGRSVVRGKLLLSELAQRVGRLILISHDIYKYRGN